MIRRVLTAVAFLTRIPVNPAIPFDGEDVARASLFFPLSLSCLVLLVQWPYNLYTSFPIPKEIAKIREARSQSKKPTYKTVTLLLSYGYREQ